LRENLLVFIYSFFQKFQPYLRQFFAIQWKI
jgi:hypothetical protein